MAIQIRGLKKMTQEKDSLVGSFNGCVGRCQRGDGTGRRGESVAERLGRDPHGLEVDVWEELE